MATTGAKFPTLGQSVSASPWSNNGWTTPTNIYADDGATANITAATYDTNDRSFLLIATGFDFSAIPDGSTIDGVQVVINCWYRSGTGANQGDLARLYDGSAGIGTAKWSASTPQALGTNSATTYTLGGSADVWGATLTAALVKSSGFGVYFGFQATANNSDIDVDYITVEVWYTPPAAGITGTLAATEAGDDSASISGDVLVSGSIAATESGNDSAEMSGDVLVTGTLAATETGSDSAELSGDVLVTGTLSATEAGEDVFTASGGGLSPITGTLAATEAGADVALFYSTLPDVTGWPESLPQSFLADQYVETVEGTMLRTGTDSGPALVRRRYSVSRTVATGNMILDADQLADLIAFYDEATEFDMDPLGDGVTRTLRFMAPLRQTPLGGAALWRIDMAFEVIA
jgi:hypothetical protein